MSKATVSSPLIALLVMCLGGFLVLEGLQITSFGEPTENTPYWVVTLAGVVFCIAGLALLSEAAIWRDLCAAMITAAMGVLGAWVSLYGDDANMSGSFSFGGNIRVFSAIADVSVARIAFGIGALMCFGLSLYALRCFAEKLTAE